MFLGFLFALVGLGVLTFAADHFVIGAARLAVHHHVSPVVVGAVLVGFGTSAPEMVVSGIAASQGQLDIGVGNIIGSNVANVSLVLAAATVVVVIPVNSQAVRRGIPVSVASVTVFALLLQGTIERWEGAVLAAMIVLFIYSTLKSSGSGEEFVGEITAVSGDTLVNVRREYSRATAGLIAVVASSWFIVDGAGRIAEALDLSGGFIGFTLIALGTSAPELVTSVQAARQGETGLLVGNLLGSNVFNSLAVGAIIGLVGPGAISDATLAETGSLLMVGICLVSGAFMVHRASVGRTKGFILFLLWVLSVVLLSGGENVGVAVGSLGAF
ncbi:MAG: sodium:calcium antiporter [Acidimicrobiales bacterium]|nr:sodium:calcium antiporter [Acidimicrobiales bacterium]MDG2217197.1 sodium:calcium antiporter [Acidimicrobiales bacterium]